MNENTLLSLITGGKYQTSADLPTFRETAHSFMDDLMQKQDAEMSEVLYPAGKNIFGQTTEPVTQEDLLSLVMGTLGPGQGARGALFGKAGRAEMKPLINKLTKDIDKMDKTIEGNARWLKHSKEPKFQESIKKVTEQVINDKFIYRSLLNYLNRYGEGMPKLSHPSKIPHYIDSVYDQGNLVAKKLKNIKWH
jgi:hypothetical protein